MKLLQAIALLTIVLMTKSTVFSQTISQDSVKCFSYEQCRKIAKDLKRGEICDSISQNQELQLLNYQELFGNKNEEISLLNGKIDDQEKSLNVANLKLKVTKNVAKFGIPGAIIGGFFVGYFIK